MPDRSTDMRIKQLSHEKAERVKKGIERLERHGQSSKKSLALPKKGGHGRKGVWGSAQDDIMDYIREAAEAIASEDTAKP